MSSTQETDKDGTISNTGGSLFKNIVIYLDTSEAAHVNKLDIVKVEDDKENFTRDSNEEPFKTLRPLIESHSGRISENLDDPNITHIVLAAPHITR